MCLEGVPLEKSFPDPNWLVALVALADRGSLRQAAKVVGVSHQRIAVRVRYLEKHLGVGKLVQGGAITPAGFLVVDGARRMLADMAAWAR